VVSIVPFSDTDELITAAYGLAAVQWTRDLAKAHQFAETIEVVTMQFGSF
jgi:acyl-CoA reductase-like NAD-dependent aldehyde dehydrogenase